MQRRIHGLFIIIILLATLSQACFPPVRSIQLTTEATGARLPSEGRFLSPPDLNAWLSSHPKIARSIKWQNRPASLSDPYTPPDESHTIAWPVWSQIQKDELNRAYLDACSWFAQGAHQVPVDPAGLTDEPVNIYPYSDDNSAAAVWVTPSYMWKLYIAHVAFSLAAELTRQLPWSIVDYDEESLRYLFNSTTMAWNLFSTGYAMGTSSSRVPVKRSDNLPKSVFGPPMWAYAFLKQAHLIGTTRLETIGKVLDWMRYSLTHFYGNDSFGNYFAVWQYRGYPPLSKIVKGTIDANHPHLGTLHWTAGCHSSLGILNQLLRIVNVPVQPVWICEHEIAYFMNEKLYMDHGDDPYNGNVRDSNLPIFSVLISEQTYKQWFTSDVTINVTDTSSPVCGNVGRRASEMR